METLVEKVLMYGDTQAEKEAICFKNIIVTYGELKKRVEGMASILHGMGIEKGHRVMLNAVSKPEYIVGLLAIQYIGAVTVAIDKYAKPNNIYDIWKTTQADIFLADGKKMPEEVKVVSFKQVYEESLQEQMHIGYVRPDEDSYVSCSLQRGLRESRRGRC